MKNGTGSGTGYVSLLAQELLTRLEAFTYNTAMKNRILFFLLNGAGTLIIETAWLKKHIAIFGSSPESYGSILFAYFLGVSAGSWYYRRSGRSLRVLYAGFPVALLFSLCLPLFLLEGLRLSVEFTYGQPLLYKGLVWMLAVVSIFPVCFFLGGFFPLVGKTVSPKSFVFLYGVQTFGTVLGIYFGSFFLPYTVGYLVTFLIGIAVNLMSLYFLYLSLKQQERPGRMAVESKATSPRYGIFAFLSGFLSLVLQVIWIRLIAMATDNSIYAFGSASLIVLVHLTVASYGTSKFPESWFKNRFLFTALLFLTLAAVIVSTEIYVWMTDGLAIRALRNATGLFGSLAFAASFISAGYFFASFVFPFILRMARSDDPGSASPDIGTLVAMNSIGCALGSVLASFVFLPKLGIWASLLIVLAGYSVFVALSGKGRIRFAAAALGIVLLVAFNPLKHPLVTPVDPFDPRTAGTLIWAKEGKYGIVSVIDYGDRRTLWLNNTYQLEAGMNDIRGTYRLGLFPTVLHPRASTLAMIGIGTGISSNGFLNSRLDKVTLVELIPEVAEAARTHFRQYNDDVLANPRVETVIDDGRHYLKAETRTFDIICSDVFTPWNEGTAYLYTVDHFRNVKKRLNDDGLFCLWLPLFQMTRQEFLIIAKSFASVFPHTTLWQLNWGVNNSAVALIGTERIDTEAIAAYIEKQLFPGPPDLMQVHESGVFAHYIGPVVPNGAMWEHVPLNTIDFPIIEFIAAQKGRQLLNGNELLTLFKDFLSLPGNPGQVHFARYEGHHDGYRTAGWHLNLYSHFSLLGDTEKAKYFFDKGTSLPAFSLYKEAVARRKD